MIMMLLQVKRQFENEREYLMFQCYLLLYQEELRFDQEGWHKNLNQIQNNVSVLTRDSKLANCITTK